MNLTKTEILSLMDMYAECTIHLLTYYHKCSIRLVQPMIDAVMWEMDYAQNNYNKYFA